MKIKVKTLEVLVVVDKEKEVQAEVKEVQAEVKADPVDKMEIHVL